MQPATASFQSKSIRWSLMAEPDAQAQFAFIAPGSAGTVSTSGHGSSNAPEATPGAAAPASVPDLAARAELLAALEAEALEES